MQSCNESLPRGPRSAVDLIPTQLVESSRGFLFFRKFRARRRLPPPVTSHHANCTAKTTYDWNAGIPVPANRYMHRATERNGWPKPGRQPLLRAFCLQGRTRRKEGCVRLWICHEGCGTKPKTHVGSNAEIAQRNNRYSPGDITQQFIVVSDAECAWSVICDSKL